MENLGVDYKLLIAQLVNFAIFFFIFSKFIAKPFSNFLQTEKKKEEEKNQLLSSLKTRDEKLAEIEAEMRKKIKKESAEIIKEARIEAETVKKQIIADGEREAKLIVERTKKQLEEERNQLYKEVKSKTVDLSMIMVNKALQEYLNEDVKKGVTKHILSNLSRGN